MFFGVGIITLLISRPVNLGRAGLFAIFCTQSNDFAIGFPIGNLKQTIFTHVCLKFSHFSCGTVPKKPPRVPCILIFGCAHITGDPKPSWVRADGTRTATRGERRRPAGRLQIDRSGHQKHHSQPRRLHDCARNAGKYCLPPPPTSLHLWSAQRKS